MTEPRACPECLRRAQLLARLAPYIERSVSANSDRPSPQLLSLGDEELARAVAPRAADELLTAVASLPERRLYEQMAEASLWATCRHTKRFPVGLRDDAAAPWALFGRGDPALLARLVPVRRSRWSVPVALPPTGARLPAPSAASLPRRGSRW
jgi:hypothetical protein